VTGAIETEPVQLGRHRRANLVLAVAALLLMAAVAGRLLEHEIAPSSTASAAPSSSATISPFAGLDPRVAACGIPPHEALLIRVLDDVGPVSRATLERNADIAGPGVLVVGSGSRTMSLEGPLPGRSLLYPVCVAAGLPVDFTSHHGEVVSGTRLALPEGPYVLP
jgi:hypothetical protein